MAGGARGRAPAGRAGASGVRGAAGAEGAKGGAGAPARWQTAPQSGAIGPRCDGRPDTARGTRTRCFFGRATGKRGLLSAGAHLKNVRMVGWSKSLVARRCWSAGIASAAYARMVSSALAG